MSRLSVNRPALRSARWPDTRERMLKKNDESMTPWLLSSSAISPAVAPWAIVTTTGRWASPSPCPGWKTR